MSIQDRNRVNDLELRVVRLEQCLADLRAEIRQCFARDPKAASTAQVIGTAVRHALGRK